ncbi:RFX DNA-binding domain-containing protein [Syncephalis fuscata]|nr:RFX DNA-binding domain-containing protein [Syncephalis fuscata]
MSYPRSVASLAAHGSAASDRTAKKAQLEETHQWLRDNFEPCHPKYSILRTKFYELYHNHAREIGDPLEPMNQATFGKIIHQVFENVQTRRLGQRGHSKYHYSGVMPRRDSPLWAEADFIIHCDPNYFVSDSRQRSQQQRQMQMAAAVASSSNGTMSVDGSMGTPTSFSDSTIGYYGGEAGRRCSDGSVDEDEISSRDIHDNDDNEDEEDDGHRNLLPPPIDCPIMFDGLTVCPSMLTKAPGEGMTVETATAYQLEELMASAAGCGNELVKANAMMTDPFPLLPLIAHVPLEEQLDIMRQHLLPWMPPTFEAGYSGRIMDNASEDDIRKAQLCNALLEEYAKQCRLIMALVLENDMAQIPTKMQLFWHTVGNTLKEVLDQTTLWHDIIEADRQWYAACIKQYFQDNRYQNNIKRFFEEAPHWVMKVAELMPRGLAELRLDLVCRFCNAFRGNRLEV